MGTQPMTGMDDVEMQTVHGDPDILQKKNKFSKDCCFWSMSPILVVVITTCVAAPMLLLHLNAHYYVAIDSVSDLDPTATRGMTFNLTLGVSSRSRGVKACIKPGSYLEVSYRGILIARSEPEVGRLCAGPRKSAEKRVAARMTRVPEGHVLDILAADTKLAPPLYDVTLHLPAGSYGVGYEEKNPWVSGCWGIQVGGLAVWCDAPETRARTAYLI